MKKVKYYIIVEWTERASSSFVACKKASEKLRLGYSYFGKAFRYKLQVKEKE